jgi:hypothetical protein
MRHIRHPCNVLAIIALLLLIVGVYRKSAQVDDPGWGVDLPVSAATMTTTSNRAAPILNRSGTLTATRPASALHTQPSAEAWSQAIDTILHEDGDVTEKAKRMSQLYSHLPAELQTECAQHLVNFSTDTSPEPLLEPLLSEKGNATAQGVLLLGLLQRTDKIRLPVLLKIASNANHPHTSEALQYLQFLLEADHGLDWDRWAEAVHKRIAESAAE